MMKLINGRKDIQEASLKERRSKRQTLLLETLTAHGTAYAETGKTDDLIKAFVAGAHFLAMEERYDLIEWRKTKEFAQALFAIHSAVTAYASKLSPSKVAELFPPAKTYNGGGEWKDYYSSVAAIKEAGGNEQFKSVDDVRDFLWEYKNEILDDMEIGGLQVLSYLRTLQGEPDLIDGFLSEQEGQPVHVPDVHEVQDRDGRSWIYTDTGECLGMKAKPRRPKWLRAVKD